MISPISFAGTTTIRGTRADFDKKISKPQTYVDTFTSAATEINGKEKKKPSKKAIVAAVVGIVTLLGAITYGAHKGVFKPGDNEVLNTIKSPLDTIGNGIADGLRKVGSLFVHREDVSKNIGEDALEYAETLTEPVAASIKKEAEAANAAEKVAGKAAEKAADMAKNQAAADNVVEKVAEKAADHINL